MTAGPLALCGGSEFGHGTRDADGHLLALVASDEISLVLPSDEIREGETETRCREHATSLGTGIRVVRTVEEFEQVAFAYVPDAPEARLLDALESSGIWAALESSWLDGAALALSGRAASSVCEWYFSEPTGGLAAGLGLIPQVAVIPHSDHVERPVIVERIAALPENCALVGIDDETTVIFHDGRWTAWGPGTVNSYIAEGERNYGPGDVVSELPSPAVP